MRIEIKPKIGYIAFASNIAKSLDFDTAVRIPTDLLSRLRAISLSKWHVHAVYAKSRISIDANLQWNDCASSAKIVLMGFMATWFFAASLINHSMSVNATCISLVIGDDLHLTMTKDLDAGIGSVQIDTDRLSLLNLWNFGKQRYGCDRWIAVPLFRNIPGVVYCPVNFGPSPFQAS